MLRLLGAMPHGVLLKAATHALALLIGMAIANSWATRQAMEVQADVFSRQQAAATQAVFEQRQKDVARLNNNAKQQAQAFNSALNLYEQGMEDASKGRAIAERQLAAEFTRAKQLTENIDALKSVNKMLAEEFPLPEPPAGCVMSDGVRNALNANIARNNAASASGDPEAAAARFLNGPDSSLELLTCEQLANGLNAVIEHDAMMSAWVRSWQAWANQALK